MSVSYGLFVKLLLLMNFDRIIQRILARFLLVHSDNVSKVILLKL